MATSKSIPELPPVVSLTLADMLETWQPGGSSPRDHRCTWQDAATLFGTVFAPLSHTQAWSTITSTPTTLAGYGIVDGLSTSYLTTWAGGTSLTTLGTIATGTWQATALADAYIASASTWNAKQSALSTTTAGLSFLGLTNPSAITFPRINADNTVSALSAASFLSAIGGQASGSYLTGLTTGTTTIGSGTNGKVLYNNSGVLGELTAVTTGTANQIVLTGSTAALASTVHLAGSLFVSGTGSLQWGDGGGVSGATTGFLSTVSDGVFRFGDSGGGGSPKIILGSVSSTLAPA